METLGRILESAVTGGLSRLVTYFLLLMLGLLGIWGFYKWVRWRIRRSIQRRKDAVKDAVIGAPVRAVRGAASAVSNLTAITVDKMMGRKPPPPPPTLWQRLRQMLRPDR